MITHGQGRRIALTQTVHGPHVYILYTHHCTFKWRKKAFSKFSPLLHPCPPLSLGRRRFTSLTITHNPPATPAAPPRLPRQAGAPCDGTPAWEDLVKSVSVSASSAPHSLFLDLTDVRDYPTTTTLLFLQPSPSLYRALTAKEHIGVRKTCTHTPKWRGSRSQKKIKNQKFIQLLFPW